MSIILGCDLDFSEFNVLSSFESNFNNDNIVFNNNLILDSVFNNTGIIIIRGSIIFNGGKLLNSGTIYLIDKNTLEFKVDNDIIGDNAFTGITVNATMNDLSLIVLGPTNSSINWSNEYNFQFGKNSPFYFSNDGGLNSKDKIEAGDKLYWNETYSKLRIYKTWRIILKFF